MGLTMREVQPTKQAVTKQLALSYQRASKRKRGEILDWLIRLTGYNRSYAARALRQRAKPKILGRLKDGEVTITLVEDERTKRKRRRRSRPRKYGKEVLVALSKIGHLRLYLWEEISPISKRDRPCVGAMGGIRA